MDKHLNQLPIIDWDLSLKLAGNKKDLADDILSMIVDELPTEMSAIKKFIAEKKYQDLLKYVHKMHGALSYSGLARIKNLVAQMESDLKTNQTTTLPSLSQQLEIEIKNLLQQLPRQSRKAQAGKNS